MTLPIIMAEQHIHSHSSHDPEHNLDHNTHATSKSQSQSQSQSLTSSPNNPSPSHNDPIMDNIIDPTHAVSSTDKMGDDTSTTSDMVEASSTAPQGVDEPLVEGDDNTPRSEDPSAENPHHMKHIDDNQEGFFPPLSYHQSAPARSVNAAMASVLEPVKSGDGAISHLDLTSIAGSPTQHRPSFLTNSHERPQPHQTLSSTSTSSSATIRPSDFMPPAVRALARPQITHPQFPNQAYSALHTQHHPNSYVPPQLRTRSSNPATNTSYLGMGAKQKDYMATPSGSRTAGNSPSGSPSLYTPADSPNRPQSSHEEQSGLYSSPFLHHTQQQAPKETHRADVDVDPVSGRKIINQYEIIDELGRGVHGKVKLGRTLTRGEYVAIKIVQRFPSKRRLGKSNNHEDKIKREIAILKKARHENIVSLIEVIDDPSWRKVYIVLEFVELGEVAWRTPGKDDICMIEYRRYIREVNRLPHDAAVDDEERAILAKGRLKREKRRRQELRNKERSGEQDAQGGWSLEFRGDSTDEEGLDGDALSRTSTRSTRSHRSIRSHLELEPTIPEQTEPQQAQGDETENVTSTDIAPLEQSYVADSESHYYESEHYGESDDYATLTATDMDGSTFGSYEDMYGRRTPSDPGSVVPELLDNMHISDVPEHFRHVPLMTMSQIKNAFRDTILGIEYLHYQGVVHRDIKPANLLQTSHHRIKISDFGVSYLGRAKSESSGETEAFESENADTEEALELAKTVGTPAFYAPELCVTDSGSGKNMPPVTQQIDVWALGVTLFCLVFGRVPFHDNNQFALMRKIAQDPVHIPRRRLRAVDRAASSRPNSRGRMFSNSGDSSSKRQPFDLEYEDVEDDLRDVLKRLLVKDPRERARLFEIKHHPWVLTGLQDPVRWIEDTDPHKRDGNKIVVTKADIADAVVAISTVERLSSGIRNLGKSLGEKLGLGRSSSGRARAKSSATNPDASNPPSAASSSSTISQDGRLASSKIDESLWQLRQREPEHPLAQSETASPEEQSEFFQSLRTLPSQSDFSEGDYDAWAERSSASASRPHLDRAASTSETAKTIRQRDVSQALGAASLHPGVATHPALPSTPKAGDAPVGGLLGGSIGDSARRIFNRMRNKDRSTDRGSNGSTRESDKGSHDSLPDFARDAHGEPSLSVSKAFAAGSFRHQGPTRSRPTSAVPSPSSSRAGSIASHDNPLLKNPNLPSRQGSLSSVGSAGHRPSAASRGDAHDGLQQRPPRNSHEEHERAREQYFRRKIAEGASSSRPGSSTAQQQAQQQRSRSRSSTQQEACPPSPDDEIFFRLQQQQQEREQLKQYQQQQERQRQQGQQGQQALERPLSSTQFELPTAAIFSSQSSMPAAGGLETSSSDDHMPSALSQSTSNPSIPSVPSTSPSVALDTDDGIELDLSSSHHAKNEADPASDSSTINSARRVGGLDGQHDEDDDEGYVGDDAVETDDDGNDGSLDSDSEGSVLEIGGGSRSKRMGALGDIADNGEDGGGVGEERTPIQHRERRATSIRTNSRKGRSESGGTMKKVEVGDSGANAVGSVADYQKD